MLFAGLAITESPLLSLQAGPATAEQCAGLEVVECRAGTLDWTAVTTNQPILLPTGDTLQYGLTLQSPSHELTQEEGSPAQTVVWTEMYLSLPRPIMFCPAL